MRILSKKTEVEALSPNEKILMVLENGYLFTISNDDSASGNVQFRTMKDHEQILESRKFKEPAPRKPLSPAQLAGHEPIN